MTQENGSPRQELEATISEALYGIAIHPGSSALDMATRGHAIRLSGNERDEGVRLVLNAIKRAGGVVGLPRHEATGDYDLAAVDNEGNVLKYVNVFEDEK